MRRLAYEHYGHDGWLAVSDGKNGPQHSYDPRDFHFGPKCAAYLWGHDAAFARAMGLRIFQDQSDAADGRLRWDGPQQCSIHLAQTAKHFSDYLVYAGQDAFVQDNWAQMLKTLKWGLTRYDPDQTGPDRTRPRHHGPLLGAAGGRAVQLRPGRQLRPRRRGCLQHGNLRVAEACRRIRRRA